MPVAGSFHQTRDAVLAAVDRVFAEPIKISFMRSGQPDASKPAVVIKAVLRVGGGEQTSIAGSLGQSWRTQLAAGKGELHIDRRSYTGPAILKGDAAQASSRPGQPWFEVLRVDDRGETRLVLELGEK